MKAQERKWEKERREFEEKRETKGCDDQIRGHKLILQKIFFK